MYLLVIKSDSRLVKVLETHHPKLKKQEGIQTCSEPFIDALEDDIKQSLVEVKL